MYRRRWWWMEQLSARLLPRVARMYLSLLQHSVYLCVFVWEDTFVPRLPFLETERETEPNPSCSKQHCCCCSFENEQQLVICSLVTLKQLFSTAWRWAWNVCHHLMLWRASWFLQIIVIINNFYSLERADREDSISQMYDLNSLSESWLHWCLHRHTLRNTTNRQVFTLPTGEVLWIFSQSVSWSSACPYLPPYLCWRPSVAGLADGECQAHLQVWPHCGVGDTPGLTYHSALPSHTQPSGKFDPKACVGSLPVLS